MIQVGADMALVCRRCQHPFPDDVTMAAAVTHNKAEHDTLDVRFELVARCLRCRAPMRYVRSERNRDVFDCDPCRRTRAVSRQHRENL